MSLPNPILERERFKSREGFCQYILASLIMGNKPPGHNKPVKPSKKGILFLKKLDLHCFSSDDWIDMPDFFLEFKLTAKKPQENRWPDLAVVWPQRIILFELKTEPGSIREGQVDEQIELGRYNFPTHRIDMIYLTHDKIYETPKLLSNCYYANITWDRIIDYIDDIWYNDNTNTEEAVIAKLFSDYLSELFRKETFIEYEMSGIDDAFQKSLLMALKVEKNRRQIALDIPFKSHEDAKRFSDELKKFIRNYNMECEQPILHTAPWVWTENSGGKAITPHGKENGIELRLSYYTKEVNL